VKTISAALIVIASLGLSIPGYAVGPGDQGIQVAQVQQLLQRFHYTVDVDGVYGPQTEKAVRSWQRSNGLQVDGEAGPATLSSLLKAARLNNATQVTPVVPPPIPHYDQWVRLAQCESGGDWSINTGNGYYGGLQFNLTAWRNSGGTQFASRPDLASAAQQMTAAEKLLDLQGWGAWPQCARRLGLR
jgi:peptidoglycan hydrolase-like protein with peptidoglycan-binding domain